MNCPQFPIAIPDRHPEFWASGLAGLDLASGAQRWRVARKNEAIGQVVSDGAIFVWHEHGILSGPYDRKQISTGAVDAVSGRELWTIAAKSGSGMRPSSVLYLRAGKAWLTGTGHYGYDLRTGALVQDAVLGARHLCTRPRMTERYEFHDFGRFVDLEQQQVFRSNISRSTCGTGGYPANGLFYVLPGRCTCFMQVRGFLGLASDPAPEPLPDAGRLSTAAKGGAAPAQWPAPGSWPTFLGRSDRLAAGDATLGSGLKEAWQVQPESMPSADDPRYLDWMTSAAWNGPVSAPVVDGDLLLVAVPWRHRIEARSSADGTLRWTWQGDGRIDSPPTIYGDLILVGGRDGTVTCLDRASGRTRWRFLAARHHRRLPAYGQVESAWPVAGSVLIHEGLAIVAAGYHPETDGGITVWGLDPVSGTVRWKQQIARDQTTPIPWPRPDGKPAHPAPHPLLRRIPSAEWSNMVRADLLAASGRCVVMPGAILQAADGAFVSGFALNPGGVALGEELPAKAPIDHLLVGNVQALLLNDRLEDFSGPGNKSPLVVARKGKVAWGQRVAADGDLVYRSLEPERRNLTIDCLSFADPANGKQGIKPRWSTIWPHKAERIAALALSTDRVVVASEPERGPLAGRRGRLALLDRASGAIVQQLDLPAAPCTHGLAIAGGAVYVTLVDGTLLRLAGAAPGPARQATVPASKS